MKERGIKMARRTVFDDVFRTICQKMPHLLIPLINEAFGTNYSKNEVIEQLRNERFEKNGEIITDALLKIQSHTYHIECQSNDDNKMVIRMAEYDFSIALENVKECDDGTYRMDFPESCVIYLRKSESKSRNAVLNIHFQDGAEYPYKMKVICVQDYSQNEIFRKKLLMFLPFYILRYEGKVPTAKKRDSEELEQMISDYRDLFERLEQEATDDFTDLYNLSIKIINHVIKSSSVRRRFTDMGGKVLELESERIMKKGQQALIEAVMALRNGLKETDLKKQGFDDETIRQAMLIK